MIGVASVKVKSRVVDVCVDRIRKKIEADEENPRYLQTVRGLGYCFHFSDAPKKRF
jgi:two-component system, OmpR family, alkaline phosphatase synthesis response regulator PhoP